MLNEVFAVKSHAWEHPQKVREVVTHFLSKQQNGLYEVQIKRIRPHRTDPQNRLSGT